MFKNELTGRRLPEFRNGYWYRRNGLCIKPGSWEYYRVTYLMAFLHLMGYMAGGTVIVTSIIGYCQLGIWYPSVVIPFTGAVFCLALFAVLLHAMAKDITR